MIFRTHTNLKSHILQICSLCFGLTVAPASAQSGNVPIDTQNLSINRSPDPTLLVEVANDHIPDPSIKRADGSFYWEYDAKGRSEQDLYDASRISRQSSATILQPLNPDSVVTTFSVDTTDLPYTEFKSRGSVSNPLLYLISTEFDTDDNIGAAMSKVLEFIGYRLIVSGLSTDPEATYIFRQSLPYVHYELRNVSVIDALTTLAGPSFLVAFDHRLRRATLDVSPDRRLLQHAQRLRVSGVQ